MVLGLLLFLFYIMLFPWVISFIPIVSLSFHVRHVHIYFLVPDHPASVSYIQLPMKPSTWHLTGNSNSTFPKLNLWCALETCLFISCHGNDMALPCNQSYKLDIYLIPTFSQPLHQLWQQVLLLPPPIHLHLAFELGPFWFTFSHLHSHNSGPSYHNLSLGLWNTIPKHLPTSSLPLSDLFSTMNHRWVFF